MPGNVGKDPVQTVLETTDHGIVLHMCNDVEHITCFKFSFVLNGECWKNFLMPIVMYY